LTKNVKRRKRNFSFFVKKRENEGASTGALQGACQRCVGGGANVPTAEAWDEIGNTKLKKF
jgi:hypothetical protein